MTEARKLRRLSWAPDHNLCQVRLFLSEDTPSQVGLGEQEHLQAKSSSSHTAEDALPPGFEGPTLIKSSDVPTIKWRIPPRISVDLSWQVVSGEETIEATLQSEREMRVFEAVYPRPSSIPQNPNFPAGFEDNVVPESQIPPIPISPLEDEELQDASDLKPPLPDAIDRDLLLKILSNRALIEKVMAESKSGGNMASPMAQFSPPGFQPAPHVKDMSYYKSLIQQHGGERQEVPKHHKYSKPKFVKPCAFFNTAGGCRNGANCAYAHDTSVSHTSTGSLSDSQTAKRIKMDREISS